MLSRAATRDRSMARGCFVGSGQGSLACPVVHDVEALGYHPDEARLPATAEVLDGYTEFSVQPAFATGPAAGDYI